MAFHGSFLGVCEDEAALAGSFLGDCEDEAALAGSFFTGACDDDDAPPVVFAFFGCPGFPFGSCVSSGLPSKCFC